jgi:hypothetical protein
VIPQNGTALPRRTGARDPEEVVVARLEGLSFAIDGDPDPAFRAATRARLVAMAAVRTPAPEPASRMRSLLSFRAVDSAPARWRSRVTAGLAGAALTVTALAGLTAVATGAGPGDLLYGLKRGTEQTQLALAADSTRGRTLLDFASTRLDELRALVGDDATALPVAGAVSGTGGDLVAAGSSSELVLLTLHTMDTQTTQGAAWLDDRSVSTKNTAPLDELAGWAAGQSAGLTALKPVMPSAAAPAVEQSLGLLAGISTRTVALRTAVACPSGPAVSGTDALGPLPAACTDTTPPSASGGTGSRTGSNSGGGTTGSTSTSTSTSVPGTGTTPPAGTGGGAGQQESGGSGRGTGGGLVPTRPVPTPALPTPSLPVPVPNPGGIIPSLPSSTHVPLPGASAPSTSGSTRSSSPGLGICIGPIHLGSC